jgi:hypothetical protein
VRPPADDDDPFTDISWTEADEEEFRRAVGAPGLSGEEGYSTLERLWIRPTCEVNGLLSGYTGEGANGDQELRAGNRAIYEHEDTNRTLRLFEVASSEKRSIPASPSDMKSRFSRITSRRRVGWSR